MSFSCVPLKAESPISLNVLGNTTSFKLEPEKALSPISVTVLGIVILEIPESLKRPPAILVMPSSK